jgi:hypothetical protein
MTLEDADEITRLQAAVAAAREVIEALDGYFHFAQVLELYEEQPDYAGSAIEPYRKACAFLDRYGRAKAAPPAP